MIRYVLTDIEGTTTPITFVHDVLFPYSKARLAEFVRTHANDSRVQNCLEDTKKTVHEEEGHAVSDDEATQQLERWIQQDRKHPALKTLQGMIWRYGYESGTYTSEVYADVRPALERWKERGLGLGIYSSGSVEAQQLLFGHTPTGDMTPLFAHFFDTAVGGKRESSSYQAILTRLSLPGSAVLFLSDVPEELDAAEAAGMRTVQLIRPGTVASAGHQTARDFTEVEPLLSLNPI